MKSLFTILFLILSFSADANPDVSSAVKKTIDENLLFTQSEDMEGTMSTIHTQSVLYIPTKNALARIFDNYQLSYQIISFNFIAYDQELAYVRVKQRTTKLSGPAFKNNDLDMLQVFKQENGTWKLWSQANMSIDYIK